MASQLEIVATDFEFGEPALVEGRVLRSHVRTEHSTVSDVDDNMGDNVSPGSIVLKAVSATSRTIKRRPKLLTTARKYKIRIFIREHVWGSRDYGEMGTLKWSTALINDLREPRSGIVPSDVANWIKTDAGFFTSAYAREREDQTRRRNSIHGSMVPPATSVSSLNSLNMSSFLDVSGRPEVVRGSIGANVSTPNGNENGSISSTIDDAPQQSIGVVNGARPALPGTLVRAVDDVKSSLEYMIDHDMFPANPENVEFMLRVIGRFVEKAKFPHGGSNGLVLMSGNGGGSSTQ